MPLDNSLTSTITKGRHRLRILKVVTLCSIFSLLNWLSTPRKQFWMNAPNSLDEAILSSNNNDHYTNTPSSVPSETTSITMSPSSAPSDTPSTSLSPSGSPSDAPTVSVSPSESPMPSDTNLAPPGRPTNRSKFLTYKILRGLPFYGEQCGSENRVFHKSFTNPGVLDFHTQIKTNLNILYIGSSVGTQFVQALQEAVMPVDREVIRYAWGHYHENTHVSLTPDNGTIFGLRVTGLFLHKTKDKPRNMAPMGGGGWLTHDVREMKRMAHQWRHVEAIDGGNGQPTSPCEINSNKNTLINSTNITSETRMVYPCEQKNFDVVVHQLAVEWIDRLPVDKSLTWDALDELVDLSFNYLGASTVILLTIPIFNNVVNMSELVVANRRIWEYAREFEVNMTKTNSNTTIFTSDEEDSSTSARSPLPKRRILVMDLYAYSVSLFLQNSIEIGVMQSERGEELKSKLLQSANASDFLNLTMTLNEALNQSIPLMGGPRGRLIVTKYGRIIQNKIGHTCGDINCTTKSMITRDGMHWCMKETGGRLSAGLACLIQCSLINDGRDDKTIRACERRCNVQYMSLAPVPWENGGQQFNVNGTNLTGIENY